MDNSVGSSDSDNLCDEQEITLFFETTDQPIKANYENRSYNVHYLDLVDEEYERIQFIYYGSGQNEVTLNVYSDEICIDEMQMLSISRLPEPQGNMSSERENKRIYFSTDDLGTVKYKGRYYIANENLQHMHLNICKRLDRNSGFCVLIKDDNWLEANEMDRVLSYVVDPNGFEVDRVCQPAKMTKLKRKYGEITRYLPIMLNDVDPQLVFGTQNFPEVILKSKQVTITRVGKARPAVKNYTQPQFAQNDGLSYYSIMQNLMSRELFDFIDNKLKATRNNRPVGTKMEEFLDRLREYKNVENKDRKDRLNIYNYYEMFKLMIHLEDFAEYQYVQKFNRNEIKLKKDFYIEEKKVHGKVIRTEIEEDIYSTPFGKKNKTLEWYSAFVENDINFFWFEEENTRTVNDKYYGYNKESSNKIVHVCKDNKKVYFEIPRQGRDITKGRYSIHFLQHRYPIKSQHSALNLMLKHELSHLIFPSKESEAALLRMHPKCSPKPEVQQKIRENLNEEQKRAVENIVNGTSYPFPFILYGPPGTGKTKTIVNAIDYIVTQTDDYILVCTHSNAACDVLFSRLLKVLPDEYKNEIYRLYSSKVKYESIPEDIKKHPHLHNVHEKNGYQPQKVSDLYSRRVLVCTIILASKFANGLARPGHFSYVFIDECGNATETASLVPIMGVCTEKGKIHAKVTIIGDPKQLGPVTKSQQAAGLGYDISLLQRLMTTDFYKCDRAARSFNENYTIQLVKNYRNHPAILYFSNKLFYGRILDAKAEENITHWFIGNTEILPSPEYPIVFHSIEGRCQKDEQETSWYNTLECVKVVEYIKRLLKTKIKDENGHERNVQIKDIGIVSPYKKQCAMIREMCRKEKIYSLERHEQNGKCDQHGDKCQSNVCRCKMRKAPDLQIGSVENFQGQEKPIIIVSTVRSNQETIGFLKNFQRLNVLLTRAKSLLIIVGNSATLEKHKNWKDVISGCRNNDAIIYRQ